jgi:hypothetical protein
MTDAAPTIRLPGILDIVTSNAYDGTVSVLIGNGDGTFQTPVTRPVGIGPAMVAVGDINGDGFPDIVTANFAFYDFATRKEVYGNNDVSVLVGTGSGGFTAASGSPVSLGANAKPFAVAVADMNGDGFGDIVVGNYGTSTVTVLKSNGNGTFTAETPVALPTGAGPSYVVTGDFNRDGKTDVITSNFGTGTITVLVGDGTGGLTQKQTITVGAGPETIALGDINGDGITDLVVTNYNSTNVSVLLGNGDGTFRAAPTPTVSLGGAAFGVTLGDINGDGKADMVVADFGNSTVSVFLGDGSGGFTADGSPIQVGNLASFAAYSVSLADVNGDGRLDMVLSARSLTTGHGEVVVLLGNGNGTFQNPASAAVYQVGGNADYAVVASLEPLTLNENASLVFSSAHGNAITVGDVDGGSSSETVTLSVAHGTLTLGSTTGLTGLTGNGGAALSFSGTIAQLNAALDGLTYTPTANYHGAEAIKVTINDNTGVQPATASTQDLSVLVVNHAPAGADNTIITLEDTGHTFAASDFGFTDPNDSPANNLLAVEITTLPTAGTLKDNGVAVTPGQLVSAADINAGDLVFTPAANVNGNGYAHFTFQVEDDGGTANGGVNLDPTANTITFNVTPVNDAPVASGTAALALPNTVTALFTSHFDDSADNQPALPGGSTANTLAGIAITGDAANATTQGSWEYSTDGGGSWTNIATSVSASSALILSNTAELRFVAVAGFGGAPGALTAHVIDSSAGNVSTTGITGASLQGSSSVFTGIDIASHDGGSTPVSTGTVSLTAVVPSVSSIHLAGSALNDASSEAFTVTFSEGVTGVDSTDFTAVAGNTVADTGISVSAVSASVYTVTVNGVTGDGSLGLNLNASGTGIADAAGTAVPGGFTGQTYTVDHSAPTVSSIVPAGVNPNGGGSETFTVTFSESVTGVDTSDFTAIASGAADTGVSSVTGSGSTYTVTVGGVSGTGTLGLNLNASGTGIHDLAGNAIAGGFTGSDYAIIAPPPPPLDGVMTDPTLTVTLDRGGDPDNATYFASSVVGLPGGGSAVEWGATGSAKIEFLSIAGAVTATTTLSDSHFEGSGSLAPLSNGDVVLTYNGSDGNTYFSIIGPSGVVVAPTEVTPAADIYQAAQLSNGDIAMLTRVGASGHSFIDVYDTSGAPVGSPVQISIAQPVSQPLSIAANDSGSFIVTYTSTVSSTTTAYAAIYANGGTSPTTTVTLGALGNATATPAQAIALSDGDFAILTNTPTSNVLQIYAPDGSTVGNAIDLPTISDAILTADLTSGVPGIVVFSDHGEDGNIYALRFDNSGNIVAGGTQSSQGVLLSLENGGNGVEVYAGGAGGYYLQAAAAGFSAGDIGLFSSLTGTAPPVIETFELSAAPTVSSIHTVDSSTNNLSTEHFTVTFSTAVTGVDASDFTLHTTGNVAGSILSVTGSGTTWTVTVNNVTGDGTLRLDLNNTGDPITDGSGHTLTAAHLGDQSYTIEHTPPAVTSVSVPANATYIAGQNLDFTAHFSEAVTVTGTPEIALTLDTGGTVEATYDAVATAALHDASALVFRYTVAGGELDSNGVAVASAIALNGGSISDAATNAAVLTLNGVGSTTGVLVDSIPPTVTSVGVPADGTYGAGQTLNLSVDFSENVLVTGTPYIDVTLDTGGIVHATYTGGSGSSHLTFAYTVASGNDDTNGIAVGSAINLNGGTIKDAATNAAVPTLSSVASTTGVLVDAIPPTVSSIHTVESSTNNLSTEDFTVTFSTPVHGVDASDFTLVGTGTTSGAIGPISGSGTTWTVAVNNVIGDGTLRLDLNNTGDAITDNFGNTLTAAHTGDQSYTIQHTPPAVTAATVPANATYVAGQALDFTTTFSEAVTVTGTPQIALTLDTGGTVDATYVAGTGTNTLTFQYVVVPGNQDLTGITTASAIDLNGGTIKDAAGNAASGAGLNLTGEPSTAGVDIDAIVPAVSSVTVPTDGTYGTGQVLNFSVNFTKAVTVNTGGGVPYIQVTLDTGGTVDATYVTGSGSTALVFQYVVPSGELDTNGIAVGSSLVLNGATIHDAIGNAAAAVLNNVASTTGVLVDSIAPTVTSINTADAALNNLSTEHFTVTFSKPVHGVDASDFTLVGTGTTSGAIGPISGSGTTWTVTVNNVIGDGTLRLDLNNTGDVITDNFGNTLTAAHTGDQSYTIDHTPPGAPTVVLAHDTGTLNTDGITSNPAITVTPAEAGGTLLYKIDGALSFSTTAPNFATNGSADGLHTVTVEQQDAAGNIGAPTTLSFTLDTIAPLAPSLGLAHDTGISGADHITNNPAIVYALSAAGDTFLYKVDGGSFSATVPPPFATDHSADGLHTILVEEVDAAGNISAPANFSFTLDTVAPQIAAVTASPSNGIEGVGETVSIVLAFGEAVTVTGGTPTLSLNDNGTATYDAAATAALHDPAKLVFDYTVGVSDTITSPLAVTGITLHGAVIDDLAGNAANLSNVATTFTGLGIDSSLVTANPDTNHVFAGQSVSVATGVLANDTDSNPLDHFAVSAVDGLSADVGQPIAGAYGTLVVDANGGYGYTANNTVTGVAFDTFTYTASNGHAPPSTTTLSIEVIGANQSYVQVPSGGSATGGFGNTVLDGSAGNATLTAATTFNAHQILIGGPGDVLNAASYGQDSFVFANNFGHETINNFHPALDVIQLQQSQFGSLAAVLADIQQVGADSVLALDANHIITIANTQHSSLTAADFHLM